MEARKITSNTTREEFIQMLEGSIAKDRKLLKKAKISIKKLTGKRDQQSRSSLIIWRQMMNQAEKDIRGIGRLLERLQGKKISPSKPRATDE